VSQYFFSKDFDFINIIQQSQVCRGHTIGITLSGHGKSSFCYFVKVCDKEYVFKFPRTDFSANTIHYEKKVTDFVRNLVSLSLPNISIEYADNRPFAFYQALAGNNMSDVALDEAECHHLSAELVQFIKKIHSVPHAKIPFDVLSKKRSIELFCRDFNYIPSFGNVEELLEENTLIHGDFHRSNILLDNDKKPCGILDFATFSTGSIYFDLGQMVFSMTEPFNSIFLNEYEKVTGISVNKDKLQRVVSFLDDMINGHYLPFITRGQYV